jgi:acyl-CoA thioesterase-2
VERTGEGRYRAKVSRDWAIWGPMGGYMASLALRAAGAESRFARPASFSCHYLGVADFDEVDLTVTRLRTGRNAESFRVSVAQGPKPILEATVWAVAEVEGLEHDETEPPAVRPPDELDLIQDLMPEGRAPFPFWEMFDIKPPNFRPDWPPAGPLEPRWRQWLRFRPEATYDDAWVDACRALVLVDVQCWPAANQHHAWRWGDAPEWMAPSLDLYVAFHEFRPHDGWLLADGHAPVAGHGLIGWTGRLWTVDGTLMASGGGQLLCRRTAPPGPVAGAVTGTRPAGSPGPTAPPDSRP